MQRTTLAQTRLSFSCMWFVSSRSHYTSLFLIAVNPLCLDFLEFEAENKLTATMTMTQIKILLMCDLVLEYQSRPVIFEVWIQYYPSFQCHFAHTDTHSGETPFPLLWRTMKIKIETHLTDGLMFIFKLL